jgi:hypothetical protein
MSADDLLRRASRALRDDGDELEKGEAALLRARVLDTVRKGERRRGRVVLFVFPIAAVLAASTALARSGAVRRTVTALAEYVVGAPIAEPAAPPPPLVPPATAAPATASAPVLPPAISSAPVLPPATSSAAVLRPATSSAPVLRPATSSAPVLRPATSSAPVLRPATPSPPAANDAPVVAAPAVAAPDEEAAALAAYERAHRLHFADRNYGAAVLAWDDYLRAAPGGRLSAEARYNRALALVHLGREAEAKDALAPFARGEVAGGYRKNEARALLQALDPAGR